jgi:hypothetical protein
MDRFEELREKIVPLLKPYVTRGGGVRLVRARRGNA